MEWVKKHKLLTVIIVFVALVVIGAAAGGGSTPTTESTSPSASPAATGASPQQSAAFDLAAFYAAVQNGQTKDQVVQAAGGKEPDSCTESEIQGLGKSELCSWTTFDGGVTVTFSDGAVTSKTKTGF